MRFPLQVFHRSNSREIVKNILRRGPSGLVPWIVLCSSAIRSRSPLVPKGFFQLGQETRAFCELLRWPNSVALTLWTWWKEWDSFGLASCPDNFVHMFYQWFELVFYLWWLYELLIITWSMHIEKRNKFTESLPHTIDFILVEIMVLRHGCVMNVVSPFPTGWDVVRSSWFSINQECSACLGGISQIQSSGYK